MDINNEEKQYLNLLEKVLFQGEVVMIEQELELKMYLVNN